MPQNKAHLHPLVKRTVLFLFLFIVLSGITGSWIVRTKLLYGAGFWIWGNMGKMILLTALVFPFLIRSRVKDVPYLPWHKWNVLWLALSIFLIPIFFGAANLLLIQLPYPNPGLLILTHINLLAIPFFLLLSVMGPQVLIQFARRFYKELGMCLLLSIFIYLGIFQAWKLWPIFSHGVLLAVSALFSLSFPTSFVPPTILVVSEFAVRIEQACSGLDSLFMFSALYLFIGLVDWKRIKKTKWILMYIPLALGLYIVNIVRVYIIILVGVLWSQKLSLELFHTYAGMVLFIIYFLVFMKFIYPKLLKSNDIISK